MALTYDRLASTTLGAGSATIVFSSISQSYTDLVISLTGTTDANRAIAMTFNGDTGANYGRMDILQTSGVPSANSARGAGNIAQNNMSAVANGFMEIHIMGYSRTNIGKSVLTKVNNNARVGGITTGRNALIAGCWGVTSAITSITLTATSGSFSTNTIATLYGIARA